jgi:hypothetical protein
MHTGDIFVGFDLDEENLLQAKKNISEQCGDFEEK